MLVFLTLPEYPLGVVNNPMIKIPGSTIIASNLGHFHWSVDVN